MLQVSGLPSGAKVRDVLRLASALHGGRSEVDQLLAMAGLEEVAGRDVTRLSGGQAQRVRFAMTLAGNPKLLFLDEPTVGMDVESRELFWREVRRLAERGTTILFATHYLAEAERFADRVVVIARGRLVADGTPSELRSLYRSEKVIELSSREPERVRDLDLSEAISVGSTATVFVSEPRMRTRPCVSSIRADSTCTTSPWRHPIWMTCS